MVQQGRSLQTDISPKEQINQLIQFFNQGKFREALVQGGYLAELFESDPNIPDIMGTLNLKLGAYDQAIQNYSKVVELRPDCAISSYNLGNALNTAGQYEEAILSYEQAIKRKEDYAEAHNNLGNVYNSLQRYQEALTSYNKAIEAQPRFATAHNNVGTVLKELGKQDEAIENYLIATKIKPDYPEAHNNLAVILNDLQQHEEALQYCYKSIQIKPDYADAYYNLAVIFDALGKNKSAIVGFQRAIKLAPDHIGANVGLYDVTGKEVPGWHIPMMNDDPRNQAYRKALKAVIQEDTQVLEIGAGSGLLAMLAAQCKTKKKITTCEMNSLIAPVAKEIVELNGYNNSVEVLEKASKDIVIGQDLKRKADLIVSEVISNEFLGEGVLDTIEDAKLRLLAPNGRLIPESGCIMINLVGGEALGKKLYVGKVLELNLEPFNKIKPRKLSIDQQMNCVEMLSDDVIAFDFDFEKNDRFPQEIKTLEIPIRHSGKCFGIIQWVLLRLFDEIIFENHPIKQTEESAWYPMFYPFYKPLDVVKNQIISVRAMHNRNVPVFKLISIDDIPVN